MDCIKRQNIIDGIIKRCNRDQRFNVWLGKKESK